MTTPTTPDPSTSPDADTTDDAQQQLDAATAHSATSPTQFTAEQQARVNDLVGAARREARAKAEAEAAQKIADAEERAGKSDLEAARLDIEKYKTAAEEAQRAANETILRERITALIADSDVMRDRRSRLAAMIDRDGLIDLDPDAQRDAVTKQIAALLGEMPEWKAASVPTSAGGMTAQKTSTITLDQWRDMTPTDRAVLFEQSPAEYASLVQQESRAAWTPR